MRRVVVGVESTESSAKALERALLEARRRNAHLTVLRAWQPPVWVAAAMGQAAAFNPLAAEAATAEAARTEAAEMLEKALSALGSRLLTDVVVDEGPAGPLLVEASKDADLVVVGSHERNALVDRLFGRTTTYVAHHAACPVLLVPAQAAPLSVYRRVVVGVDGSPQSLAALRWARDLAREEGCPLVALHVHTFGRLPRDVEPELGEARAWLERVVTDELGAGTAMCEVEVGAPGEAVLRAVGDEDLLVLGARGTGGFAGLHLGSVSDQCCRHAPCAVAIVRGASG
jgi:nucleotide-binding universal stress UspA family protein